MQDVQTGVKYQAKSDASGNYEFVNEHPGTYRVHVEATGFASATASEFALQVNARQRVDLNLQVGASTQNVTVTDAASLLETDSSSRGQVINPKQIIDLPLNGRSYADLTLLVPGAARSPLENQSDSSRDASFNINGLRSEYNNFLLDGVDNNAYGTSNQGFSNQVIQPNPDALAEFKVETDNYSAEFGRSPGAVINATLKSGTNQFHGRALGIPSQYGLELSRLLPSRHRRQTPLQSKSVWRRIWRPDRQRQDVLLRRLRRFPARLSPSPVCHLAGTSGIGGDFSAYNVSLRNPLTGQAVPGNRFRLRRSRPLLRLFSRTAVPNLPGNSNNFSPTRPTPPMATRATSATTTSSISESPSLPATARATPFFNPPSIPGLAGGNANGNVFVNNKQGVLGSTWTVNATSVLEARLGINYTQGGKTPVTLGASTDGLLLPNQPAGSSLAGGLLSLGLGGGLSQLGRQNSNPQYQDPFIADPKVNFSKVLGRHSLKMGFEYQLIDTAVSDFHPQYGIQNFTGYFSDAASTANLTGVQQQVYSLADFIYGAPSHYELDNNPVAHLRQRMYFGYLQDDYRLSSKVTLNLGVRYEFGTPQYERDNKLSNFDPITQTLISATGGSLYNRSLVHPDAKDWAPRVGFAWQVGSKTVIRSGYGLAYVQFNRLGGENLLAFNGPNIIDASVDQVPGMGLCASVDSPANSCFRTTAQGFPNNSLPRVPSKPL